MALKIQTHIVNGLYFEVFVNSYEIEKVLLEGKPLERLDDIASRTQYRFEYNGKTYRMKFDCGDEEGFTTGSHDSSLTYQSTFEAMIWDEIEEDDKQYFLALFGTSPAPVGVPEFRGFVIQEEVRLIEDVITEEQSKNIRRMMDKYRLSDLSWETEDYTDHNTAYLEDGRVVIYDWGIRKTWGF